MVIYFSGTGNSEYCARLIASRLGDELIDSAQFIKHGIAAELISGKPWVFCAPTYAWQLPRVFVDFIRSGNFEGEKRAYFVMTCGGSIGAAGEHIEKLCKEKGLEYMGVLPVVMPENYVAMFPVPEKEKAERMVAIAAKRLEKRVAAIEKGEAFESKKSGAMDKMLSVFVNKGFYGYAVSDKKFHTTDKCTSCGKCEQVCPLGNVRLEEGIVVWGGNCTHCMACICRCPQDAIEYGKASKGKYRYVCPEFEE